MRGSFIFLGEIAKLEPMFSGIDDEDKKNLVKSLIEEAAFFGVRSSPVQIPRMLCIFHIIHLPVGCMQALFSSRLRTYRKAEHKRKENTRYTFAPDGSLLPPGKISPPGCDFQRTEYSFMASSPFKVNII